MTPAIPAVMVAIVGIALWQFYLRPKPPPVEPASVERMAFPLPEKPSIAVLPFVNLTGNAEQEYLADGISENIIGALAKIPEMFVIARNSTFSYKGKPVKVQRVAEELGVQHVLEGSVQKSGDRIRVTAQLIDAMTGHHTWSEKYDLEMKDLFDLIDGITQEVVVALQVKLTTGEQASRFYKTDNLDAWGYLVKAGSRMWYGAWTKENFAKARELLQKAVELDPGYVYAWVMLARTHMMDAIYGWSESRETSVARTEQLVEKALGLDDADAEANALLGAIHLYRREYEEAIAWGEKSIAQSPNAADIRVHFANTLRFAGRPEQAIAQTKKAMRLHPFYPAHYLNTLAVAYLGAGRQEEAITAYQQLLRRNRSGEGDPVITLLALAACYAGLDRMQDANAQVQEALRIRPDLSVESWSKFLDSAAPYKDPAVLERFLDILRNAGLPEKPPLPLPDKPSIAVLPFTNMSGDPEQEYLSDGITEQIITGLSQVPYLFVIARNSTFVYKGRAVKVSQVGRELGVRYVLEGSVQRSGERIRITAQLIDATTGHHLWAERYDRELKDIFAIQDEITMKIMTGLQVKLTGGEQARLSFHDTDNLEAFLRLLQGAEQIDRNNPGAIALAREMFGEAIALDPEYATAYSLLGYTHMLDVYLGSSHSPRESLERGIELAQKAIALDDSNFLSHSLLGYLYTLMRQHDEAIVAAEQAVTLAPNSAEAHMSLARALAFAGRPEEAVLFFKKAIRLNPFPPTNDLQGLCAGYRQAGMYEEAIEACNKALHLEPTNLLARLLLAASYSSSGREEEAREEAAEVRRINPKFSLEYWARILPYKNREDTDRLIDALRQAGLK
jgi:TolB-like protein/cytochrome c-type biogenesis protein CcmH/NrfG